MLITQRIKLSNNNYYIKYDCIYKNKEGHTYLCLKDNKDFKLWDGKTWNI